ncbi:fimbrial biogenesis chaperone [Enterobacter kobei]|uniref:fimbrial biogenesis chaperone n=1 Tax=Enterobacter kobei TaxID=208224 RepID=UPI003CF81BD4
MNSLIGKYILCLSLCCASSLAQAGISLDRTRLIIKAGDTGMVTVQNQLDTKNAAPFLIQSTVTEYGKNTRPQQGKFFVSPPLFRLDPGGSMGVQVQMLSAAGLPTDRESVFAFRAKAIPQAPDASVKNYMAIIVTSGIKLFYRPEGLSGNANDSYKAIRVTRQGDKLLVTNPTPYYVTFQTLSIGGKNVPHGDMVPPLGSQTYTVPAGATGKVSWQTINDYGGYSDVITR